LPPPLHNAAPPAEPAGLVRRLGPLDAAAIVISNVIGGGIFFVPIIVAGLVPSGWALLGVWLFGGVLAFAGAMAYAELATLRPRAGGEYVYLRDAYGRLAAFLSGWTSFVAGFSGAIAAGAVALAEYIGRFAPFASDHTPLLTIPIPYVPMVVTPQALMAILSIALLSAIHLHTTGRLVHNLLANAQHNLANRFESGQGVAQNYAEAVKWYRLAANQKHPMAQANLGVMYERGHGVRQDFVQAQMWFILSASLFLASEAKSRGLVVRNRDQLARIMTPEQLAAARQLAREWRPAK